MGAPKLTQLSMWGAAAAYKEGRAYRHPVSGKQYPSITTLLKAVDKSGLIQWSVDLSVDWCVKNVDMLLSKSIEGGKNIARYRHKDVLNERAEVGTGIHESIESEHTGSWNFPELDAEQQEIMGFWRKYNEQHDVQPILSEFTVAFEEHEYMGTADGYWLIDGVLTLVDVKTSRNTWPEHYMQLAALYYAPEWLIETSDMVWTPEPARKVEQVAIMHLRADERDEYGRVTKPGFAELKVVQDLDLHFEQFISYAGAWHSQQKLKNRQKERELLTSGF
jgi:hypothetical protein